MKRTFTAFLFLAALIFVSCEPPSTSDKEQFCTVSFTPEVSEQTVVNAVESAKSTIDIALYGFENEAIVEAVLSAAERGVVVRCCTEYDSENEGGWQAVIDASRDHPEYDITLKLGNSSGIMHNKYFIIDNTYIITGSTNLTNGMQVHFNNLVLIKSPSLAADFQKDFEVLYAGYNATAKGNNDSLSAADNGFNELYGDNVYFDATLNQDTGQYELNEAHNIGGYEVKAYFTPYKATFYEYSYAKPTYYSYYNYQDERQKVESYDNAMNVILPLLENAETSIYIFSFAFTDKVVMDLLAKAYDRGVKVKVWMDNAQFQSSFSHSGKSVIALAKKIGDLRLCRNPNGGLLHHKVILVDGETVVLGSLNFSSNAVEKNDENFLVIKNAAALHEQFMGEAARINEFSHVIRLDDEDYAALDGSGSGEDEEDDSTEGVEPL